MKPWPLAALALALLPAASPHEDSRHEDKDPLAGYAPVGKPERCLGDTNLSPVILDRHTVGLRRSGRTWWVSRVDYCPAMEPLSTLVVERFGGQLCEKDKFRVITPTVSIPSAYCFLGSFQRYDRVPKTR